MVLLIPFYIDLFVAESVRIPKRSSAIILNLFKCSEVDYK
jgi:hypothetical protein